MTFHDFVGPGGSVQSDSAHVHDGGDITGELRFVRSVSGINVADFRNVKSYTPALTAVTTDPNLGSGGSFEQFGRYVQIGLVVWVWVRLRFGTSGVDAGSGAYLVSLPVPASSIYTTGTGVGAGPVFGSGQMRDNSASTASTPIVVQPYTDLERVMLCAYPPSGSAVIVANGSPFTVAASDVISFQATYIAEAA